MREGGAGAGGWNRAEKAPLWIPSASGEEVFRGKRIGAVDFRGEGRRRRDTRGVKTGGPQSRPRISALVASVSGETSDISGTPARPEASARTTLRAPAVSPDRATAKT